MIMVDHVISSFKVFVASLHRRIIHPFSALGVAVWLALVNEMGVNVIAWALKCHPCLSLPLPWDPKKDCFLSLGPAVQARKSRVGEKNYGHGTWMRKRTFKNLWDFGVICQCSITGWLILWLEKFSIREIISAHRHITMTMANTIPMKFITD